MPAVPEELLWSTSRVCRKRSAEEAGGVAVEAVNDLGPFITQQLHSYCFSSTWLFTKATKLRLKAPLAHINLQLEKSSSAHDFQYLKWKVKISSTLVEVICIFSRYNGFS